MLTVMEKYLEQGQVPDQPSINIDGTEDEIVRLGRKYMIESGLNNLEVPPLAGRVRLGLSRFWIIPENMLVTVSWFGGELQCSELGKGNPLS